MSSFDLHFSLEEEMEENRVLVVTSLLAELICVAEVVYCMSSSPARVAASLNSSNLSNGSPPPPAQIVAPPSIKVWLRLDEQSDDEAIKLVFPLESDISDVLLQCPSALNVNPYRPSELAAFFAGNDDVPSFAGSSSFLSGNGVPAQLSNRTSLASICDRSNSLNLIIRPKSAKTVSTAVAQAAAPQRPSSNSAPLIRSKSPAPLPPSHPVTTATTSKPQQRAASPFARHTSATVLAPGAQVPAVNSSGAAPPSRKASPSSAAQNRAPSTTHSRHASPSPAGHRVAFGSSTTTATAPAPVARRPSPCRVTTTPRVSSGHVGSSSVIPTTATGKGALTTAPKRAGSGAAGRLSGSSTEPSSAIASAAAVKSHRSAVAGVTTAVKVTTDVSSASAIPPSAAAATVVAGSGVCSQFKPQWGNILCASCKHSKQAHIIKQQEFRRFASRQTISNDGPSGAHLDPNAHHSLLSHASPSRRTTDEVAQSADTSHDSLMHGTPRTLSALRRGPSADTANLLEPPNLANVSFDTPSRNDPRSPAE